MPTYIETFCNELISSSVSNQYINAMQEWVYHGDRWTEPTETHCICGHPIMERCLVKNKNNGIVLVIGNCCIKKFGIEREHWNKSKLNYLQYAQSKCPDQYALTFCINMIAKLQKYSGKLFMTEWQKRFLESIAGKPYRWNYKYK